jgi:hypothetical protein
VRIEEVEANQTTAQHSSAQKDGREQMWVEQITAGVNRIQ